MSRLTSLSTRERFLILVMLPVALAGAAWHFGWKPLQEVRAAREAEIAAYRLVTAAAAREEAAPAVAPDSMFSESLAARVTSSAEAAGIALSRLEPEGQRLRVTLAEAPFAQVLLWISEFETERGVVLSAIEVDRRTAPGTVSARLLLETAQ